MNHLWRELKRLNMGDDFEWSLIDRWPLHDGFLNAVKKRITIGLEFYSLKKLSLNEVDVGLLNESYRDDWVQSKLKEIKNGSRLLDAGAGESKYKKWCSHLSYVSQDFGHYDGRGDGKGSHPGHWDTSNIDITCDITNIPEPDGAFDAILCTEVFEHIPNPLEAIEEFYRLLKSGGLLIITAPFCSMNHLSPYHFSTGFNRYYYEHHFRKLGLKIDEIETNGNYFEYFAQEIRRLPSIAEKYSNQYFTKTDNIAKNIIIRMLNRFSLNDRGSDELLCYGYHILAHKEK